jgi:hypothetical protein
MRSSKPKELPKVDPWKPPHWDKADASAIQALMSGNAQPHQQKRALAYIIESLCGTYDMSFRPTGDRDTCFAEGKRFVGNQIVKLTKINLGSMKDEPSEQG